jgi:hypothetical protein
MRTDYYHRILPIVGKGFSEKSIAVIGADFCGLVADTLARCGITRIVFSGNETLTHESSIPLTFGIRSRAKNASRFLEMVFRSHNKYQRSWDIKHVDFVDEGLLESRKVDLLIGGGDYETCKQIIELSSRTGIPAVVFSLLREGRYNYAVFVNSKELPGLPGFIKRKDVAENLSGYDHSRRLD